MPETRPTLLAADKAARLTDFARACKAAARAVSLYPTAHPAIRLSLGRLVESAARATATGAFNLSVQSGTLAVEGARLEKPDPAVNELAELLRRHLIGGLAIQGGSDADSWRAFLLLLARTPEEVRADGGIAHLWAAAGGPSIEIREIDYAEVLRERAGEAVDLDEVVSACIKGAPLAEWDEATRRTLLAMLSDPQRLAELASRLVERTESAASRSAAFLTLLRHVGGHVATIPHEVDPAFDRLATVAGTLSADTLATVLGQRDSPSAMVGGMNVVGAVDRTNTAQKALLLPRIAARLGGLEGKVVAIWGLAFKPRTDDIREEPALTIIDGVLAGGGSCRVYDPKAMDQGRRVLGDKVTWCRKSYDAVDGADALVVVTEWNEFREPDFERIRNLMRHPAIFDGRNIYDPRVLRELGFHYEGIGRW